MTALSVTIKPEPPIVENPKNLENQKIVKKEPVSIAKPELLTQPKDVQYAPLAKTTKFGLEVMTNAPEEKFNPQNRIHKPETILEPKKDSEIGEYSEVAPRAEIIPKFELENSDLSMSPVDVSHEFDFSVPDEKSIPSPVVEF
mgnify:CR=1 FL=1